MNEAFRKLQSQETLARGRVISLVLSFKAS